MSDPSDSRILCDERYATCEKCSENACNNQPKFKKPTLSCIHCEDSQKCAFGQTEENSIECKNDVIFSTEESCFTRGIEATVIIQRGCTLDDLHVDELGPEWCNSTYGCTTCNQSSCNIKNVHHHWCLICESEVGGECANIDYSSVFIERCGGSVYPVEKRGCYTMNQSE